MLLCKNRTSDYIITPESVKTSQFAAKELQKYIHQASGAILPIVASGSGPAIILKQTGSDSECDYYSVKVNEQSICISGSNARSVLYGVYAFLETVAGIRFFSPEYEYVPSCSRISVPSDYSFRQAASFRVRQISTEWSFDAEFVDWAVKNRFNCICASMAFWQGEKGRDVLAAAKIRGMSIGLTGHLLFELLKADEHYETHPEWFPEVGGERNPTKNSGDNFCYSNAEAVKTLAENLKRFCDKFPLLSFVSLWQGDGGLVCHCKECQKTPFMVLYGKAVAQVAEILGKTHPQITVSQLAYNFLTPELSLDMMQVPAETAHVPTMFAFWGQNLTEPLETNSDPSHQAALKHINDYCNRKSGACSIFSYHTDTYMNSNMCPIFGPAISADLKLFKRMGIDHVCLLWIPWNDVRPERTMWIAWQNGGLYGRCAMDDDFDIAQYRKNYYVCVFGNENIEAAEALWNALNNSLRPLFELTWSFAPYRFSDGWGCGFNRAVMKWELSTDYKTIGKKRLAILEQVACDLKQNRKLLTAVKDICHPELDHMRDYYDHCTQRASGLAYIAQAQYSMQAGRCHDAAELLQNAVDTGMESEKELTLEWKKICQTKLDATR